MRLLLLLLVAASALAESFDHAVFHRACAPWDGPAVSLTLTTREPVIGKRSYPEIAFSFYLDRASISSGKRIRFPTEAGHAGYCPREAGCVPAQSGEIRIEKYTADKELNGTYELQVEGKTLKGKFRGRYQDVKMPCG